MSALLLLFLVSPGAAAGGGPTASEVRAGQEAQARGDSQAALRHFLAAERSRPDDPLLLQEVARQYSDLCDSQPNPAACRQYARLALAYSQRAAALAPRDPVCVLSVAIACGKLGLWSGTRDKVAYSRQVLADAERAEALDPRYAWAHHVIGRWNYEVARLGAASRFYVRCFCGGLPPASFAAAIRELNAAVRLEPGEPAHWIDLGFAYAAAGDDAQARRAWEQGLALPGRQRFQREAKERAREALDGRE